ncbi:MAG: hypothetical protein ACM34O_01355 [Ignavibacteria bacterium]
MMERSIWPGQLSPYIAADLEYHNFKDLDIEAPDGLPEIIVAESAISGSRSGGAIGIGIGGQYCR